MAKEVDDYAANHPTYNQPFNCTTFALNSQLNMVRICVRIYMATLSNYKCHGTGPRFESTIYLTTGGCTTSKATVVGLLFSYLYQPVIGS